MKKLSSILLSLVLLFSLTACGSLPGVDNGDDNSTAGTGTGSEYEDNAVQLVDNTVYYNEYIGLSYTVPSGWWSYSVRQDNFSTNKGTTDALSKLDVRYSDGYAYMFLGDFANLQYSSNKSHIGIALYAEQYEDIQWMK